MAHVNASMLDLSEITIAMDSRQSSLELNSFKVSSYTDFYCPYVKNENCCTQFKGIETIVKYGN